MNDHQVAADRLREEIEKARCSGKPKAAVEVLDRLECKYAEMARNGAGTSRRPD